MAEVIDFEDLKKDSGDLKKLEDSELQKLSNNIQKLLDLDKTFFDSNFTTVSHSRIANTKLLHLLWYCFFRYYGSFSFELFYSFF